MCIFIVLSVEVLHCRRVLPELMIAEDITTVRECVHFGASFRPINFLQFNVHTELFSHLIVVIVGHLPT